jgi:hypothetical protein
MWILEPSTDTWKRPEVNVSIKASASLVLALIVATGCVVTDTIEFEDKVNYPMQVLFLSPANDEIELVCKEHRTFTLKVWDPDEEDVATYDSKIYLWPDPYKPIGKIEAGNCVVSELSGAEEVDETHKTGLQMTVTCDLDLTYLGGVNEGDVMLTKIIVSDRRFIQQELPDDARTAEVFWALELLPDISCDTQGTQ